MARADMQPVVFDFETHPIQGRPHYPPKPVGVSIQLPTEKKAQYYAFGHPTKNNCSERVARQALTAAYKQAKASKCGILAHNLKFDADVAETHWGLKIPAWEECHDTMFELFLVDPHSPDLKLKPSSERLLGLPPSESDALRDYAIAQKWIPKSAKEYGHLISKMPGDLVGKYANGDVTRTLKLHRHLNPIIRAAGIQQAYDRERELMPFLLESERTGILVNLKLLAAETELYSKALGDENTVGIVDRWLQKKLKAKDLNVDSDADLAEALIRSGYADEGLFLRTPKGAMSVSKKSLPLAVTNPQVLNALRYRSMLQTRLGTFLRPWLEEAREGSGRVYPHWNQVRQAGAGARTGRISASRFMNAPVGVGTSQHDDSAMLSYSHPDYISGLPLLPAVRKYLLPNKGEVWGKRDFAQQELRILAHFEDGLLLDAYRKNPKMDMHQFAVETFKERYGVEVSRTRTKTIGFSLLYGMGVGELAQRLQLDVATTKKLKEGYMGMFAGLKGIEDSLKARAKAGEPYHTWGGRRYYVEPPKYSEKYSRMQTFEYKMLNYLIQGSAADCTKQALINYAKVKKHGTFLITVHDEINISVPKEHVKSEMKILSDAMADMQLDCPMLSDGSIGKDWATLKDLKEN
jgi:DNA polymerase I-like protein with 3'-5' exonuclease and polymerase domains